jgi:hypothetical protein
VFFGVTHQKTIESNTLDVSFLSLRAGGTRLFWLALSFYRDGCDWTSGKIAMRSPRTEPSQSSLAT